MMVSGQRHAPAALYPGESEDLTEPITHCVELIQYKLLIVKQVVATYNGHWALNRKGT
jgi:hypothetical protein